MGLLDYLFSGQQTNPLLDQSGADPVGNPMLVDPNDAAEGKRRFLQALATMPSVQAAKDAVKAPVDAYQGKFDPMSDEGIGRALGMAGLAMTGGVAGTGAGGVALGSGPIRAYHGSPHDSGDWLRQLTARYEPQTEVPYNPGGQQVSMFLPDGRVVADNLPSHDMLMRQAGINVPLEQFMRETGAVRAHGPDNFEIHAPLTSSQARAIRRYARDNGSPLVAVDVVRPNGQMASDFIDVARGEGDLLRFVADAFSNR